MHTAQPGTKKAHVRRHATKTTRARSAAAPARAGQPRITFQAVSEWAKWAWRGIPQGKSRIDPRLIKMEPVFASIIEGLLLTHDKGTPRPLADAVVRLAEHATTNPAFHAMDWPTRNRLAAVVCDWMVRCALPRWFDRLPDRCLGMASAERLAQLDSVQWTDTIVRAIATVTPMWIDLGRVDRGTADEAVAITEAHYKAGEALAALASLLTLQFAPAHNKPAFVSWLAIRLIRNSHFEADSQITDALPALLDALLPVRPGDSQQSVAARCVWPGPYEKPAKAVDGARS